jgi:hypothetical protein
MKATDKNSTQAPGDLRCYYVGCKTKPAGKVGFTTPQGLAMHIGRVHTHKIRQGNAKKGAVTRRANAIMREPLLGGKVRGPEELVEAEAKPKRKYTLHKSAPVPTGLVHFCPRCGFNIDLAEVAMVVASKH